MRLRIFVRKRNSQKIVLWFGDSNNHKYLNCELVYNTIEKCHTENRCIWKKRQFFTNPKQRM